MDKDKVISAFQKLSRFLTKFDEKSFLRPELGTQSLQEHSHLYHQIKDKYRLFIESFDEVGQASLKSLFEYYDHFTKYLADVAALDDIEFINNKEKILVDLLNFHEDLKDLWQDVAGVIKVKSDLNDASKKTEDLENLLKIFKNDNDFINEELKQIQNLKNSLEQQLKEFQERYSSINTNVELETQVNIFEAQAKKDKSNSYLWLLGMTLSSIILVVTLVLIYCNFNLPAQAAKQYAPYNAICKSCGEQILWVDMIRHLFFKLLILSVEVYILTFCVKNYNACMHNKTNNEHRHNSFAAALHFYNTTTSERREEILIKVADAIFTYQKSGYYGKDSEPSNPSLIQNVIEKVSGKS